MQHFRHGQIHIWALGLTSHPFCLSKKSKHKKVKAERQWERVAINTPVKNNRGLKWCQKGRDKQTNHHNESNRNIKMVSLPGAAPNIGG